MKELSIELRNGWTLRVRIEPVVKSGVRGDERLLRFSVWDEEQKQGVAIQPVDAQVLLSMNSWKAEQPVETSPPTVMGGYIPSEG